MPLVLRAKCIVVGEYNHNIVYGLCSAGYSTKETDLDCCKSD